MLITAVTAERRGNARNEARNDAASLMINIADPATKVHVNVAEVYRIARIKSDPTAAPDRLIATYKLYYFDDRNCHSKRARVRKRDCKRHFSRDPIFPSRLATLIALLRNKRRRVSERSLAR